MTKGTAPTTDPICDTVVPRVDDRPPKSSLKGSLVVAAVMFGWLLIVFGMSAAVASNDPNIEAPIAMSRGVVVTPADGWYSAEDVWDVGESGVALQKAGVYVAFWVDAFSGSNEELMSAVLDELRPSFDSFHALPARPVVVAGDLPALGIYFTGITEWGQEENELVVLSYKGTSVIMLAEALMGQMAWVQGDIEWMLNEMVVPR